MTRSRGIKLKTGISRRVLSLFLVLVGCSAEQRIKNECGSPIYFFETPIPARFGYYNLTYPSLHKFKERFGYYPEHLDSLTKLDSVSYSHMERAWKLKYRQIENGKSYSIDEFSETQIDSLEQVKKDRDVEGVEHMKKWEDCKNRILDRGN